MYYKDEGQWFDDHLNPVDDPPLAVMQKGEDSRTEMILQYPDGEILKGALFEQWGPTLDAAPNGSLLALEGEVDL